MSNRINSYALYMFCLGVVLSTGCFPEDSMEWSADGSVGLLRAGDKLYVVDGNTGTPSPVADHPVSPWPDMSADGKKIVYAEEVKHATLAEGLKALPGNQSKMIASDAQRLREKVLGGVLSITDFNSVSDEQLGLVKPYREWVVRSLCENADEQLTRKLGDQALQQGKAAELSSYRLLVVTRADMTNKEPIATSALGIVRPRFSPDGRYVAWLELGPEKEEQAHLFVAAARRDAAAVYIASDVSLGFDWRPDSQALAYVHQEGKETMFATVREGTICDPNGKLLDELSDKPETPLAARHLTGESKQLAGTLFEPLMKVEYGIGGRLFFSSASGKIPAGDLDEPRYSLFCYDFATGAVAEVLPSKAQSEFDVAQMVDFFSLSPDGRKVLLPLKNGRFAIYELGATSFNVPIKDDEEFGKDMPKILPAWKGNEQISCQVSEKSHFLNEEQQKRGRKEIVVLDAGGKLKSVLSTAWPDDALPKD
jgi:hypothetical protein